MAKGKQNEIMVSFKSGHYKTVEGRWHGDSVWCHIKKDEGGMVHINKEEVEYIETFEVNPPNDFMAEYINQYRAKEKLCGQPLAPAPDCCCAQEES